MSKHLIHLFCDPSILREYAFFFDMHKLMQSCVDRYEEVVRKRRPDYVLPECDAPFVEEDMLPNPARTPLLNQDGSTHGLVCPYCTEAFATDEFRKVKNPVEAKEVCKELGR